MQTENSKKSYFIPKGPVETEQVIRRNRFITYLIRAVNKDEAQTFIKKIKAEHPMARHHCWAYIAGNPHSTTDVGMTDDGEPHGTAGKPMLSVLQYSEIGEIAVIVVRYSSGIKLGTGGLVRAYQSSVQLAIDELETIEKVDMAIVNIQYPYNCEEAVRNFITANGIDIMNTEYLNNVKIKIKLPSNKMTLLMDELQDIVNGRALIS